MFRKFRGRIDEGTTQFIRGWAADGKRPVEVTVQVGGTRFAVPPTERRPDLASVGLPLMSGFMLVFPEPLRDGDRVDVLLPNGSALQNSPFVYAEADLSTAISGVASNTFTDKMPSHQNAIDIFRDVWVSAMPDGSGLSSSGTAAHFKDKRPQWAESVVGPLKGRSVLELGPFEGYVSTQLEQLGAEVLSIEGDLINFLKCLVVKNALSLSTTFLLGDFTQYMEKSDRQFDICWASGVLYHSPDPIRLLKAMCNVAPVVFIWTQYFDESIISRSPEQLRFFRSNLNKHEREGGREIILHYRSYAQKKDRLFSGGPESHSYWLSKDDIVAVLQAQGFQHLATGADDPHFENGPAFCFLASRFPLERKSNTASA